MTPGNVHTRDEACQCTHMGFVTLTGGIKRIQSSGEKLKTESSSYRMIKKECTPKIQPSASRPGRRRTGSRIFGSIVEAVGSNMYKVQWDDDRTHPQVRATVAHAPSRLLLNEKMSPFPKTACTRNWRCPMASQMGQTSILIVLILHFFK